MLIQQWISNLLPGVCGCSIQPCLGMEDIIVWAVPITVALQFLSEFSPIARKLTFIHKLMYHCCDEAKSNA